jgi:hypothetical protein
MKYKIHNTHLPHCWRVVAGVGLNGLLGAVCQLNDDRHQVAIRAPAAAAAIANMNVLRRADHDKHQKVTTKRLLARLSQPPQWQQ